MSRIGARIAKLERGDAHGWRAWKGVAHRYWPDRALLAFLAEAEGWPPGYLPSEAELRAVVELGKGGTA